MEILSVCLDEIGLSGLEGCTLGELWRAISNREPPVSFQLDDPTKSFIWTQLLRYVEEAKTVQFFQLPQPREPVQVTDTHSADSKSLGDSNYWVEYIHPFPYRPISIPEKGIRGSCASFKERSDVTAEILQAQMELNAASERYGDRLILVGSQELRERSLVAGDHDPCLDITDLQYCLLEVVGSGRHHGVLRPFITTKYMKIDARSTFHHVKKLRQAGLVTVKGGVMTKGRSQVQHLLLLSRYNLSDCIMNPAQQLCSILQAAPHQALPLQTIFQKMGGRLKSVRSLLVKKGIIESVTMADVSPEFADTKVARLKAHRLLKPYEEDRLGGEEGMEEEEEEEGDVDPSCQTPVVFELPLEVQGYRLIDSFGPEGIINSDFCSKGLAVDMRTSRLIVKALIRSSQVVTIVLDDTSIRKIKLISARHVSKNKMYESLHAEKAKSGVSNVGLAIRTGDEFFLNYEKKGRRKPAPGEAPVIKLDDVVPSLREQVEGQDEEVTEALAGVERKVVAGRLEEEGILPADLEANELESHAASSLIPDLEPPSVVSCSPTPEPSSSKKPSLFLMTYHQLKRTNIIMNYVENARVLQGTVDLCKHVREMELREGREHAVDKKTVRKLIFRLQQDKRICHREVELKSGEHSQLLELVYVPDATEEELSAAVEKALKAFQGAVHRKELRNQPKEKKRKKKEEEEEEEEEESSETENEASEVLTVPHVANKFQRLRHFHYFLWILAHGFTSCEEGQGVKEEGEEEGERQQSEPCGSSQLQNVRKFIVPLTRQQPPPGPPSFLSPTNFPWVEGVHQLPVFASRGQGWLSYNDILHHMPLSLFSLLMKILPAGHLSSKFLRYFESAEHKNKLLHQLPKKLHKHIISKGRDVNHLNTMLEQLQEMKLITMEGYHPRHRANICIYLNQTAAILDTSVAKPRRSFFLEEARPLFKTIHHRFSCLADLEKYWFQLQTVCLQTPIIVGGKLQRKIMRERERREHDKPDLLYAKDSHALPYTAFGRTQKRKKYREFNKLGFGAGGLPPLSFSHANRNWTQLPGGGGRELPLSGVMGGGREEGQEAYGPGMGLAHLPQMKMYSGRGEEEDSEVRRVRGVEGGERRAGEEASFPPAKRLKLASKPSVKAAVVRVPSSQVKQYEGGRGQKRMRAKRAIEAAKKVKKARESMARHRAAQRTSVIIVDGPGEEGEEVEEEKDRVLPERVMWYPHEDSFLILAYLTATILHKKGRPAVTYTKIKEALHKEFQTSRHKTTLMVKRHMLKLRRQNISTATEICLAESLQDLDSMAKGTAPDFTFEAILEFVQRKYKSQQGQLLPHTNLLLPHTQRELYESYEIVEAKEAMQVSLPSVGSEQEINQALLTDLIIAVLGAEETSYDQYKAFKLFESFPEADVRAAFEGLRSQYLIKQKRSVFGIPRHKGPLESQSFDLSANFYSRLEQHYPSELFHEVSESIHDLSQSMTATPCSSHVQGTGAEIASLANESSKGDHSSSNDVVVGISNTAVSLDNGGPIRIQSESAKGGTVAVLVRALFGTSGGTRMVSCDPVLSDPPVESREGPEEGGVTHQLLQSVLEEEEELEDEPQSTETQPSGQHPSRFTGTGLSALLQVNESAVLRHVSVDIEVGLNWAKLLDPLPEEELEKRKHNFTSDNTDDHDVDPLSLDEYLKICETHLGFLEADLDFVRVLYEVVDASGERGVPLVELQTSPILNSFDHVLSVQDHIQSLLNFRMVHLVGINQVLVVSHPNCGRWLMSSEGAECLVPYCPWSSISSSDPNSTLLVKYRQGVLAYIMAHPGVTLLQLASHFSGVLHLNGMREILQSLELAGDVKSSRLSENCISWDSQTGITCYEAILC